MNGDSVRHSRAPAKCKLCRGFLIENDIYHMEFSDWIKPHMVLETLGLKGNYKGSFFQRLVAAKYLQAPTSDPRAIPAFQELAQKINRQSEFLSSKWQMNPSSDDPYPSMKALSRSIQQQRDTGVKKPVVNVYAEPPALAGQKKGHPVFSNDDNVKQRGVHDVIAHYYGQHPFSARGEYGAYNRHLKTLCNPDQVKAGKCLAAKAMFTEVVAQTSYYYVYGNFADQKAVILEDFDHARVGYLHPNSPLNQFFQVTGKLLNFTGDWNGFSQMMKPLADELLRQENQNKKLEPVFTNMTH